MTGLLCPQQIACTANFQIPHGDFKAGAEFCKLPNCTQTLFRYFREHLALSEGKVSIGMAIAAPNAPSKLMKLG